MSFLSRRIPTLLVLLLLTALSVAVYWYWIVGNKPDPAIIPTKVRISNISDSRFTVSWVTKSETEGQVEWGEVGGKLENVARDDRDTSEAGKYLTHYVSVSELQPNTRYSFRIVSGEKKQKFDDNGNAYSVTTGTIIASTPVADSFYGNIENEKGKPMGGVIAYLTLPGSQLFSTIVKTSGTYSFGLSTLRTEDLREYIKYDPAATVASILLTDGASESTVTVSLSNSSPVPTVAMGENADFRQAAPVVAKVEPINETEEQEVVPSTTPAAEKPQILNVEPLSPTQSTVGEVSVLNPGEEGEEILTVKPEFFGKGPPDTVLSVTVHSTDPYSGVVVVEPNGEWSWTPPSNLEEGEHTLTIAYIDEVGAEKVITRSFVVKASAMEPAFEATPAATTTTKSSPLPSPTPRSSAPSGTNEVAALNSPSPTASPREVMPSTEEGVPVSGVASPTVLTVIAGAVIMLIGVALLAI